MLSSTSQDDITTPLMVMSTGTPLPELALPQILSSVLNISICRTLSSKIELKIIIYVIFPYWCVHVHVPTVYAEIFVVLRFSWVPSTTKIKPTKILPPQIITACHCVTVMSIPRLYYANQCFSNSSFPYVVVSVVSTHA